MVVVVVVVVMLVVVTTMGGGKPNEQKKNTPLKTTFLSDRLSSRSLSLSLSFSLPSLLPLSLSLSPRLCLWWGYVPSRRAHRGRSSRVLCFCVVSRLASLSLALRSLLQLFAFRSLSLSSPTLSLSLRASFSGWGHVLCDLSVCTDAVAQLTAKQGRTSGVCESGRFGSLLALTLTLS